MSEHERRTLLAAHPYLEKAPGWSYADRRINNFESQLSRLQNQIDALFEIVSLNRSLQERVHALELARTEEQPRCED